MIRNVSVEYALRWHLRPRGSQPKFVMPPRSVLRLAKPSPLLLKCGYKEGDTFTVNYYSRQDSLNCVWLIDPNGDDHTWDQHDLRDTFEVVSLSDGKDLYGLRKPELPRS